MFLCSVGAVISCKNNSTKKDTQTSQGDTGDMPDGNQDNNTEGGQPEDEGEGEDSIEEGQTEDGGNIGGEQPEKNTNHSQDWEEDYTDENNQPMVQDIEDTDPEDDNPDNQSTDNYASENDEGNSSGSE